MALTNIELSNAKPKDKDYKLSDGKGLYLLVKKNGSRYWRWNYRFDKKQKTMALGVYPEVPAKAARAKRDDLRLVLADGIDPQSHMQEVKRKQIMDTRQGTLINEVIDDFLEGHYEEKDEKTIAQADGLVKNWIKPELGHIECSKVSAEDLLKLIRKMEAAGKRATAHKVATLLKKFFAHCIADPEIPIDRNWMLDIMSLLKPMRVTHRAAMTDAKEVGEFLAKIDSSKSYWLTKMAIRLSVHWFIRPGELRHLTWADINFTANRVEVSKDKMKSTGFEQDHWIPLTRQTKEMLLAIQRINRPSDYVFPSIRNLTKPMSENTVNGAIREMGYVGKQTAHGLRATARTLLDEELKQNPNYIEHQLAHKVKDVNGRAYNRTTQLDERRVMLQLWSDYLDDLEYKASNGIEIKSRYEEAIKGNL